MKEQMRRNDRQLDTEKTEKILKENVYGILSLICEDGYPYGIPMSYSYMNGTIYFHHTNEESLMNTCIDGTAKACFTVVGATELQPSKFATRYESVIAFGTIKKCENKMHALMKIVEGLSPDYIEAGRKYANAAADKVNLYEFKVEQLTGKAKA